MANAYVIIETFKEDPKASLFGIYTDWGIAREDVGEQLESYDIDEDEIETMIDELYEKGNVKINRDHYFVYNKVSLNELKKIGSIKP